VPILDYSGNKVCYIGVLYDMGIMKDLYKSTFKRYVTIEVLFLLIITMVIFVLIKMLLLPIEKIVAELKRISDGNYEVGLKESNMNELNYIVKNINNHLATVKKREGELRELNSTLELKVDERTKEINEKNVLLEKKIAK
jgi:Signal transduction histidine kinase, nitrate/nitrite-specific